MGNFYVNHTVRAAQAPVVALLEREGHTAYVSPTLDGHTVVCDQACDLQDVNAILVLGRKLSSLEGPVVAFLNHDDDVLCYWLFDHGELIEDYNSCPDYFGDDDPAEQGGDGEGPGVLTDGRELCRLFGNPDLRERVRSILADTGGAFVSELHQELVGALGLPSCTVGAGYRYVAEGDSELGSDDCIHVGRREQNTGGDEDE